MVSPAAAHHYAYLAEDPAKQDGRSPYTDNGVMWQWQQYATVGTWVEPSSDPTFVTHVQMSIDAWQGNMPALNYAPVSEAAANIRFHYQNPLTSCGTPPPGVTILGCNGVDDWENRPTENASYISIRLAHIYVNGGVTWTPEGRVGTISHELGHSYGLHEQYIEPGGGGCWDYTVSVMDTARQNGNGQWESCDRVGGVQVQGPTLFDLQRLQAYWGQGDNGHWRGDDLVIFAVASSPPGSATKTVAEFKWADFSWTEAYHYLEVFYSSNGTNWGSPFYYTSPSNEIGVHYLTQPRALGLTINRLTITNPPQPAGYFMACARPYFIPFQTYGTIRCSNAVELQ